MPASPAPAAGASAPTPPGHGGHAKSGLAVLALGALGVVYGDIGTSPLYAMKESLHALAHGGSLAELAADEVRSGIFGILSLIVWSLILVISVKYLVWVLRADNKGEGGIMALMALALMGPKRPRGRWVAPFFVLGLFGTALLYGDGSITPAISVVSAVEGLQLASDRFQDPKLIVAITAVILIGLFAVQRFGTARVGAAFGPIVICWFLALAALGLPAILGHPGILAAFSPHHALYILTHEPGHALVILGAVFLVVTGGEALYADMGHFGAKPIRLAWFGLVLPSLLVNYFGQGALILGALEDGRLEEVARNPFYSLAPAWALYPLIGLATLAAIIASQALISGAYSVTRQAIQLGYCPPLRVVQTSHMEFGQIYIPLVNWLLLAVSLALVVAFKTSAGLAAVYGIAVVCTMVITVLLLTFVARRIWGWSWWAIVPMLGFALLVDLLFLAANFHKIPDGGWVPLAIGVVLLGLFLTWKQGRLALAEKLRVGQFPLEKFLESIARGGAAVTRVPGTAVFLTGNTQGTPGCLLHNLKHNKVLHQRLLFVTVLSDEVPVVPAAKRLHVEPLGPECWRIVVRYGFMEEPDIPRELAACAQVPYREQETTFFLGRERIVPAPRPALAEWRLHLFGWMSRNARAPSDFFNLPPNRVVELGAQVEL